MSLGQRDLVDRALEEIPRTLSADSAGRESVVTGEPQFWGDCIRVPIDPSISYGTVQGISPAWLTVLNVEDGVAQFELDEDNARMALSE